MMRYGYKVIDQRTQYGTRSEPVEIVTWRDIQRMFLRFGKRAAISAGLLTFLYFHPDTIPVFVVFFCLSFLVVFGIGMLIIKR